MGSFESGILTEEAEHVDVSAPVALGYGDASAPMSLGLHFLGQQLPRGPNGEFECLCCGDAHWYRKCNAPASLEEMDGQRGPLQALDRSMIDLQHRMEVLEREPSPVPSLSPPLLSLVATTSAVAPVSDSIIIEGPVVTVPLDYVPAGIYQGRRVWAAPVAEEDLAGQGNGP